MTCAHSLSEMNIGSKPDFRQLNKFVYRQTVRIDDILHTWLATSDKILIFVLLHMQAVTTKNVVR
jgi:hypothetical protein